ncbi:hypothetical protein JW930_02970 [Candidatus Woesearchaeota archaeon]|nr:hypothetical protein [Candidatus Woesearchaeota archaeon]
MELEVIKEKELPLLSRRRVSLWLNHKGPTASRNQLIKQIADKFKVEPELIIIKHIYPQFGTERTKVIVHIYKDNGKIEFFEHKNLVAKHRAKEDTDGESKKKGEEAHKQKASEDLDTIREE